MGNDFSKMCVSTRPGLMCIFLFLYIFSDILCVDVSPINATTVQPIVRMIHLPSNPFAADLMNDNVQPAVQSVASVQLTADERSELFTDTGCTQNAMVAVMGYSPQDDKRICQFYDPKTGGCFKGGKCRLEHVAKLEGRFIQIVSRFLLSLTLTCF